MGAVGSSCNLHEIAIRQISLGDRRGEKNHLKCHLSLAWLSIMTAVVTAAVSASPRLASPWRLDDTSRPGRCVCACCRGRVCVNVHREAPI